jgi:MFS family permease
MVWQPTIIASLGYSNASAQLMTVPPYAVAFVLMIIVAILCEKTHRRAPFIMMSSAVGCIGYIILLTDPRPGPSYVGVFFAAAGIYPATAIVLAWPCNNVSGQTKRAVANAMQISIGNLGAVMGTQLYRPEWTPRFFVGHGTALGYLVANIVVVGTLWAVLERENRKKAVLRAEKSIATIQEVGQVEDFEGDEDPRWIFQT